MFQDPLAQYQNVLCYNLYQRPHFHQPDLNPSANLIALSQDLLSVIITESLVLSTNQQFSSIAYVSPHPSSFPLVDTILLQESKDLC